MPVERAGAMPDFIADLNQIGVKTYVHAVNKQEELRQLSQLGVYGIYTDFLPNRSRFFIEAGNGALQQNIESPQGTAAPLGNTASAVYVFFSMMLLLIIYTHRDRIGRIF
jgi:hypothetical protein